MKLREAADLIGVKFNTLFYHIKKTENSQQKRDFFYQSIPLIKYSLQKKKICSRNTKPNTSNASKMENIKTHSNAHE